MSYFARRQMKQKATYWATLSQNKYGEETYDAPVEIDCQWNDVTLDVVDANGQHTITKSQIMVDRDLQVGGLLLLSELADVSYPDAPLQNERIERIIRFDKIPRVRADKFMRVAYV